VCGRSDDGQAFSSPSKYSMVMSCVTPDVTYAAGACQCSEEANHDRGECVMGAGGTTEEDLVEIRRHRLELTVVEE
jgi:hypothetical protein